MKKIVSISIIILALTCMISGIAIADSSYGPPDNSGDGIPDGNQFIRPDNPGTGPAPNSGDGIPDGSGF